jgi:hypothetical protein
MFAPHPFQQALVPLIDVLGRKPDTLAQLCAAELNVLMGSLWVSVACVHRNLVQIKLASGEIRQAEMAEGMGREERQAGPRCHPLHDLVPHLILVASP